MGGDILVYYSREVCAHKYGRLFWTYPIVLTEDLRCLVERKYNQCPRQDRYNQFCPIDTTSPFWTVAKATRNYGEWLSYPYIIVTDAYSRKYPSAGQCAILFSVDRVD